MSNYIYSAVIDPAAKDGPIITVKLNQEGLDFRFYLFEMPSVTRTDGLEVMDLRPILENCEYHPEMVKVPASDKGKTLILGYPKGSNHEVLSGCLIGLMARINQQCATRDGLYDRITATRQIVPKGQKPLGDEVVHPWNHDPVSVS